MLRRRIIEEIYGFKGSNNKVLNPELLPEVFFGKRAVLDVVLEDEAGHFMIWKCRYRLYTGRRTGPISAVWLPPGWQTAEAVRDYIKLKPFYQIIFL